MEFLNLLLIFTAATLVLRRPERERLAFRLLIASPPDGLPLRPGHPHWSASRGELLTMFTLLALAVLVLTVVPVGLATFWLGMLRGDSPCVMCWEQRIGMLLIALLGLFVLRFGPRPPESVRIPTSTGSLIVLVVTLEDESLKNPIKRELINQVYQKASEGYLKDYLLYSERQNVSSDIIGNPRAAAIIEGTETHTRTASICIYLAKIPQLRGVDLKTDEGRCMADIPVTQAVIYGWYDNELGSYTNLMGDLTVKIAETL